MNRIAMAAMLGVLALTGCETTETVAYMPPTSGPTATIILSRERLVAEWNSRMFVAAPGGATRSRLGGDSRYEYNKPYTIAAGQRALLELEEGPSDESDAYVIVSTCYAFTPLSGATYLVRPCKPGYNADGSISGGALSEPRHVVVDVATRQPPPDLNLSDGC